MEIKSEKAISSRKEEIINACQNLYETMSFKDITILDISKKTSFSRPSIYNYFQTKEEIFLALLEKEYQEWTNDLNKLLNLKNLTIEEFADKLASTFIKRKTMLKLMSMNLYDIETNSRLENLVSFKKVYYQSFETLTNCLKNNYKNLNNEDIDAFMYAFFPFLFGIYPYTYHTDKQIKAMKIVNIKYKEYTIYEIIKSFVYHFLKEYEK